MFKNLKKKLGNEGADLTALSTVVNSGSLGSSMTSLRRSESKTSSLSHSRESLQSHTESFKTVIPSPTEHQPENDHTDNSDLSESLLIDLGKAYPTEISCNAAKPTDENDLANLNDAAPEWFPAADDEDVVVAFSFEDVTDSVVPIGSQSKCDANMILTPSLLVAIEEAESGGQQDQLPEVKPIACDHSHLLTEIETLKQRLLEKEEEEKILQRRFTSQELDHASLKAELNRMRDLNRQTEDKLRSTTTKTGDLTAQLDSEKSEKDSWKIAHDQSVQQLKDKSSRLETAQKKNSSLESKLAKLTAVAEDQTRESEMLQDENSSLKGIIAILENQMDKLSADILTEKAVTETAYSQVQNLMEENSALKSAIMGLELQTRKLESDLEKEKISQHTTAKQSKLISELQDSVKVHEKRIVEIQQLNGEAYRKLQDNHAAEISDLQGRLGVSERDLEGTRNELRDKLAVISRLEGSVEELERRSKTAEYDLEGKESELAVFRRRSAKDTEIKLRERDKQIASLEKQLAEFTERAQTVTVHDHTSIEYTKNVILRFLVANGEERLQLLRPVSVLLQMTDVEEHWLRDVIAWKMSWLPGPKPELNHVRLVASSQHAEVNGHSALS